MDKLSATNQMAKFLPKNADYLAKTLKSPRHWCRIFEYLVKDSKFRKNRTIPGGKKSKFTKSNKHLVRIRIALLSQFGVFPDSIEFLPTPLHSSSLVPLFTQICTYSTNRLNLTMTMARRKYMCRCLLALSLLPDYIHIPIMTKLQTNPVNNRVGSNLLMCCTKNKCFKSLLSSTFERSP